MIIQLIGVLTMVIIGNSKAEVLLGRKLLSQRRQN